MFLREIKGPLVWNELKNAGYIDDLDLPRKMQFQ